MDMYQHDSPNSFRFVLRGDLTDAGVQQLQFAWETAKSILNGKELIIEVSGLRKSGSCRNGLAGSNARIGGTYHRSNRKVRLALRILQPASSPLRLRNPLAQIRKLTLSHSCLRHSCLRRLELLLTPNAVHSPRNRL